MRQHYIWCVYVCSRWSTRTHVYELPEDDLNEIETSWSVFKCFNMNVLDQYFIVYKSALVGVYNSVI